MRRALLPSFGRRVRTVSCRFDPDLAGGRTRLAPSAGGGSGSAGTPDIPRRVLLGAKIAGTVGQFVKFAVVGLAGFVFASAVLYAARRPLGLYGAGLLAYAATATMTWALNRVWTFDHDNSRPAHQQWALFVVVNAVGFALNWGTYALLVMLVRICAEEPVLALAAGSATGALANFALARAIVFPAAANAAAGKARASLSEPPDE